VTTAVIFRIRRSYLVLGILCTAAITALGGFSVIGAALNLDGSFRYPLPTAVGLGCFWGGWFLAAVYTIAFACRDQLTVTAEQLTHKGVFRTHTTPVAAITAVEWIRNPNRVVVRYPRGRIKLDFDGYGRAGTACAAAAFADCGRAAVRLGSLRGIAFAALSAGTQVSRRGAGLSADVCGTGCRRGLWLAVAAGVAVSAGVGGFRAGCVLVSGADRQICAGRSACSRPL